MQFFFLICIFITCFAFSTYIANLLVSLFTFVFFPCIQLPQSLHNATFAMDFFVPTTIDMCLSQLMFFIDLFNLTITFIFVKFTYNPFLSNTLVQLCNYLMPCCKYLVNKKVKVLLLGLTNTFENTVSNTCLVYFSSTAFEGLSEST